MAAHAAAPVEKVGAVVGAVFEAVLESRAASACGRLLGHVDARGAQLRSLARLLRQKVAEGSDELRQLGGLRVLHGGAQQRLP